MKRERHPTVAETTSSRSSFLERHHFLLRRLHSLTGIVPIGVFLIVHLITNSSVVWGKWLGRTYYPLADGTVHGGVETFQHEVNFIHSMPFLPLIEWSVLFLPILFHAGLGFVYAFSGRPNVRLYHYPDNWRYTLQRITGYVGFVYILIHVLSLRFGTHFDGAFTFGGAFPTFSANFASSTTARHFQESELGALVVVLVYAIGVGALVFHFANGLWTAAITWGLTVTVSAQKRWGHICTMLGIVLTVLGAMAIYGFSTLDVEKAQAIEQKMLLGYPGAHDGEVTDAPRYDDPPNVVLPGDEAVDPVVVPAPGGN